MSRRLSDPTVNLGMQAHLGRWVVSFDIGPQGWRPDVFASRRACWYSITLWLFGASLIRMPKPDLRAGVQVQIGTRSLCIYTGTALKEFAR